MKVIEADFIKREVLSITEIEYPVFGRSGSRVLKTRENASRDELIDQAATVEAAKNLAEAQGHIREAEDLAALSAVCIDQVESSDWERVNELAFQKLDDLPLDAG